MFLFSSLVSLLLCFTRLSISSSSRLNQGIDRVYSFSSLCEQFIFILFIYLGLKPSARWKHWPESSKFRSKQNADSDNSSGKPTILNVELLILSVMFVECHEMGPTHLANSDWNIAETYLLVSIYIEGRC